MRGEDENLDHVLGVENQHETVALARALCPFAEAATDQQILACVAVVEARGDVNWVAEELGYKTAAVRRLLQSRLSEQIMRKLAKNRLGGIGYIKAVCALESIAESQSQTGNARNNAAKAIIEMAEGENAKAGGGGEDGADLNTMTLKQLESFVNAIKRDLVRLPQTIDHMPTDI